MMHGGQVSERLLASVTSDDNITPPAWRTASQEESFRYRNFDTSNYVLIRQVSRHLREES